MQLTSKIESIIDSLEDMKKMLKESGPTRHNDPDADVTKSYPYAVGYTESGIFNVLLDLKLILLDIHS